MTDEKNNSDFVCMDAASSTGGCLTPSTTMSEDMPIREAGETLQNDDNSSDCKPNKTKESKSSHDNHAHHMEHNPIPGRVYMIRTREKPHRILSLVQGRLELRDSLNPAWGVYWSCSEIDNFLYFRNTTSETYLSYGKAGRIIATKHDPETRKNFVAIRQEGGGYILHTFHPEQTALQQVTEEKNFLKEQAKGGTPLDFINAKYVYYCVSLAVPDMEREVLLWEE
ncbi:hypothetical protein GGI35DRAFT_454598 [Trichoderma velutinum]